MAHILYYYYTYNIMFTVRNDIIRHYRYYYCNRMNERRIIFYFVYSKSR